MPRPAERFALSALCYGAMKFLGRGPRLKHRSAVGAYAAVTRATLDGKNPGGWFAEEKITLSQAIEAYTMGAAFAEFQEREKGSITPGKLADMVILSDNIFDLKPEAIRNVKVTTAIVDGKVIYGGQ